MDSWITKICQCKYKFVIYKLALVMAHKERIQKHQNAICCMSIPFNFEHIHCGDILHKTIISLHKNPFNAHSTTYTVRYIE